MNTDASPIMGMAEESFSILESTSHKHETELAVALEEPIDSTGEFETKSGSSDHITTALSPHLDDENTKSRTIRFRQFKKRPQVLPRVSSGHVPNSGSKNRLSQAQINHIANQAILTTPDYVLVFKQFRTTTRLYFYTKHNISKPIATVKDFKCTSFSTLCCSNDGKYLLSPSGPKDVKIWKIANNKLSMQGKWQLAEPQGNIQSACWLSDSYEVLVGTDNGFLLSINVGIPHILCTLPLNNSFSPVVVSAVVSIAPCPFASRIYAVSYACGQVIIYDGSKEIVGLDNEGDASLDPIGSSYKTLHVIKSKANSSPIYSLSWHRSSNPHHQALAGMQEGKLYVWSVNLGHSVKRIRYRQLPENHEVSPYQLLSTFSRWYKHASVVRITSLGVVISYVASKEDLQKVVFESQAKQITAAAVETADDKVWLMESEYLKCVSLESGETLDKEAELEFTLDSDLESISSPLKENFEVFPLKEAAVGTAEGAVTEGREGLSNESLLKSRSTRIPQKLVVELERDLETKPDLLKEPSEIYSRKLPSSVTLTQLDDAQSYNSSPESLQKFTQIAQEEFDTTGSDDSQESEEKEDEEETSILHAISRDTIFRLNAGTNSTISSTPSPAESVQRLSESLGNLSTVEEGFKKLGLVPNIDRPISPLSPSPIRIPDKHPARAYSVSSRASRAVRVTVDWDYYLGQYDRGEITLPSLQDDTERGDDAGFISDLGTPLTSPLDSFFHKTSPHNKSSDYKYRPVSIVNEDLFIDQ